MCYLFTQKSTARKKSLLMYSEKKLFHGNLKKKKKLNNIELRLV